MPSATAATSPMLIAVPAHPTDRRLRRCTGHPRSSRRHRRCRSPWQRPEWPKRPRSSPAIRRLPLVSKATDVGMIGFAVATAVVEFPNWLLPGSAISPAVPLPATMYASPAVSDPKAGGGARPSRCCTRCSRPPLRSGRRRPSPPSSGRLRCHHWRVVGHVRREDLGRALGYRDADGGRRRAAVTGDGRHRGCGRSCGRRAQTGNERHAQRGCHAGHAGGPATPPRGPGALVLRRRVGLQLRRFGSRFPPDGSDSWVVSNWTREEWADGTVRVVWRFLGETRPGIVLWHSDGTFLAVDGRHVDHIHAGKRRLMASAAKTVKATSGAVLNR